MIDELLKSGKSGYEIPVVFNCQQDQLLSIVHVANNQKAIGILIVVGGEQYRVGAHRQFVLLARELAEQGISVMRFDQRSNGDSTGETRCFDQIDNDIESAINVFTQQCPDLTGVVIWAICDAASAASFYAYKDCRIKGMVLLNPWVYTEKGEAKTYFKHYYLQHLGSSDFWKRVFNCKVNYVQSFYSFMQSLKQLTPLFHEDFFMYKESEIMLPDKMFKCLKRFKHPILIILSGKDLTANQFRELVKSDVRWKQLLSGNHISRLELSEADHTFSTAKWRDQVASWTVEWVNDLVRNNR